MDSHDFIPLELKACSDGTLTYCVALDAHMPARLENMLPDFLMSTSHDLRTPCASIQAASSLLLTFPAVAADAEACSLLRAVDAACTVLMRVVSNVLSMRQLQRDGRITLGPPRAFDPQACVARAVKVMCDFDGATQRVTWADEEPLSALPITAGGDERALEAALHNVLMAAVRLGAWMADQAQVVVHVAAEPIIDTVAFTVTAERATHPEGSTSPPPDAFVLVVHAETPGRPLSNDECSQLLAPFGMAPADKGGGTGLPLFVARGIAREMGGDLELECGRSVGSLIKLRVPLRVPDPYLLRHLSNFAPPPAQTTAAKCDEPPQRELPPRPPGSDTAALPPKTPREAGAVAMTASQISHEQADKPPPSPRTLDELELTARMFECLLTNSDDVFAICRVAPERPDDPDSPLMSRIEYISPSVAWRLAFSQQAVVGQDIGEVCHPEDREAFDAAVRAAYYGQGQAGGQLMVTHRSKTASGDFIWCHSAGMCEGDLLYLVCRDVRTRKSVEVALRVFMLATSHDLREPCNAILVSLAVLERRACVAPSHAGAAPPNVLQRSLDTAHMEPAELVACMRASCGLLLGIVGNVLSAPQVQAGELTLQTDTFSPAAVLRDVLQACQLGSAAAATGGGVQAMPGMPLPAMVESDAGRLAQVVQNLCACPCDYRCRLRMLTLLHPRHQRHEVQPAHAGAGVGGDGAGGGA
jgi:signal transduction histidine kinase